MDVSDCVAQKALDMSYRDIIKKSLNEVDASVPYFQIKKFGLKGARYSVTPVIDQAHPLMSRMIFLSSLLQDMVLPLTDVGLDLSGYINICLDDVLSQSKVNRDCLVFVKERYSKNSVLIPEFESFDGSFQASMFDDKTPYESKINAGCHVGTYDLLYDCDNHRSNRMQVNMARMLSKSVFPIQNHVIAVNGTAIEQHELFSYPGFNEPLCDKLRHSLSVSDLQRYKVCLFDTSSRIYRPHLVCCNAHLVKVAYNDEIDDIVFSDQFMLNDVNYSTLYSGQSLDILRKHIMTLPSNNKMLFKSLYSPLTSIRFLIQILNNT